MQLKFLHHTISDYPKPTSLPMKVVKVLLALFIVSLVLVLAAVLFIYIAIGTAFVFGYFWWKTREVRKQMRSAQSQQSSPSTQDGLVIEGEVIRETKVTTEDARSYSDAPDKIHQHNIPDHRQS
jgi:predicted negative regulator of RcsB-dependent stress response